MGWLIPKHIAPKISQNWNKIVLSTPDRALGPNLIRIHNNSKNTGE